MDAWVGGVWRRGCGGTGVDARVLRRGCGGARVEVRLYTRRCGSASFEARMRRVRGLRRKRIRIVREVAENGSRRGKLKGDRGCASAINATVARRLMSLLNKGEANW